MQVTDACTSSGMSDDTAVSDSFDFDQDAEGAFDGFPEEPGAFDVIVKVRASLFGSRADECLRDDLLSAWDHQCVSSYLDVTIMLLAV